MSFEKYNRIFFAENEGALLKPFGAEKSFAFKADVKENTRYRLFTTGNTKSFYQWKTLEDYPSLYRDITDSLNTEKAEFSQYCLDFSSKEKADFVRRIYKKVMWPPRASILRIPTYTNWKMGLFVKAEDLKVFEGGFLQMRVEVRLLKKNGRHSVLEAPDYTYTLPIPEGTYSQTKLEKEIEIPENTANVGVFIEGTNYLGKCYLEEPFLSSHSHNMLPEFTTPATYHRDFSWTGQYLSRKELPEFEVTLNGHKIYVGEIFERCHLRSEWELDLPSELLRADNTITYRLISSYHDPLPYEIFEVGLIESENNPLTIVTVSESGVASGKARVLIKTNKPNMEVQIKTLSDSISAPSKITFKEAGLHGILIDCLKPCENAEFVLSCSDNQCRGVIKRIVIKEDDGVIVGTGDMIYILQETKAMEDYLCWYFSNNIGNFITIRPCYAWSGTRTVNHEVWMWFRRLMEELDVKYVLMADGRQLPGLTANPSIEELAGKNFLGAQRHETDSIYYSGQGRITTLADEQYFDMSVALHKENAAHSACEGKPPVYYNGEEILTSHTKEKYPNDYALYHEKSVEQLNVIRGGKPRHTGPSVAFKYLNEAGYSWLGAETAYSSYEPLLAFLRGFAKAKGMDKFGVHHALQWSTAPHDSKGKYRRYRLMQYVSYILGVTDINTEEGLWRMEENFSPFHRFSDACLNHINMEKDFYNFISTHTRKGEFYTPIAAIHGRDDGFLEFAYKTPWGAQMNTTEAEKSWDMLNLFYPISHINGSIYNYYCPEDKPVSMFTGTPYGNIDAVPIEYFENVTENYKAAIFFGYNNMTEADAQKLYDFASLGGKVLLTRAHLTVTTKHSDIISGNLKFNKNALSFCEGEPQFIEAQVDGKLVSVCINNTPADEVLLECDGGEPLLMKYKVGKGEILLFNTKEYPANEGIKPYFENEVIRITKEETAKESAWVKGDEYIEFAAYDQSDGSRHLYILAVDWYRNDTAERKATVKLNNKMYEISVPFGVLIKCVTKDGVAAFCNSEKGEVLDVSENEILVQGTGKIEFTLLKEGEIKTILVDFSKETVQKIRF